MFDEIVKELRKIQKDGVPLQHKFDAESTAYISVGVFVAVTLSLIVFGLIFFKKSRTQ